MDQAPTMVLFFTIRWRGISRRTQSKSMYVFNVEVELRKGLGPEWVTKNFTQAYDDVPEEVPESEVKAWAVSDTERELYSSEDYSLYGKNWIVVNVYGG